MNHLLRESSVVALALAFVLAGCGQKGPLALPGPASAASTPAASK